MRRPTSAFFPSLSLFDAKGVALFFGILSFYRTHSDNEKTKRKEEVNEPSEHGWSLSLSLRRCWAFLSTHSSSNEKAGGIRGAPLAKGRQSLFFSPPTTVLHSPASV
jgi:hypothetical protein